MRGSTHTPIPCPPSTRSTRERQEDTLGTEAAPLHNPALFTPLYKTIFPALFYKATLAGGREGTPQVGSTRPLTHPTGTLSHLGQGPRVGGSGGEPRDGAGGL